MEGDTGFAGQSNKTQITIECESDGSYKISDGQIAKSGTDS